MVLPSLYNPNLCSDENARRFAEIEVRVTAMIADLLGYDQERIGGLFTFGGTGTIFYGAKIGLEKAQPGTFEKGLTNDAVLVASQQSHYASYSVAGWLGIGCDNVVKVRTHHDNAMDLSHLESELRRLIEDGKKIACVTATMGTTDAFGVDDLHGIYLLREKLVEEYRLHYVPHIHADAVIGWAWSVFKGYDYHQNRHGFRGRTIRAIAAVERKIQHLHLADSLGIDFHKTGFTPYVSSMVLVKEQKDFQYINRDREKMPYLYHSGSYHPGMYTLETTRSAAGPMAALANLIHLGREGLQVLLGHAVEMSETLREQLGSYPELTVFNDQNSGPVTLFRAYPTNVDTFELKKKELSDERFREHLCLYNEFNRRIFTRIHELALVGEGVDIGLTECYRLSDYGEPIVALKTYVLSPFTDENRMQEITDQVLAAQTAVEKEMEQELALLTN